MLPSTNLSPHSRQWRVLFACWLLALVATAGSLFLSEVMEFAPCVLCWYQRIPMYALVVVLGVGLQAQDPGVVKYAKALALIGLALATYHCLLYLGFIPQSIQPCGKGVSCADVQLQLWGVVTIPLMSLLVFGAISLGLFFPNRKCVV
ncbi:disulfide bond formation protein B [Rhodoferax ferrireducens]|uniref:disulfide bond formation protein B n=1 Tax=Rhodoferax ferrireducens TaxID=192843 RepID=UPI00298DEBB3|nr:disulfide bond formation protein B [Rhodoferax ferrireducens]WPC69082.1 disulfide bond formation protein B [Rhodoferax ferrireducens]